MRNPFRLLPQGPYALLPATLSMMAWVSVLIQDGCDYSKVTGPSVEALTESDVVPFAEVGRSGFRVPGYFYTEGAEQEGRWEVQFTEVCASYGETPIVEDPYWRASRVLQFITQVFGGSATLFLWCSVCTSISKGLWRFTAYEMLAAAVFETATFIWFKTAMCDQNQGNLCAFHFGSKADMVAAALWLFASVAAFIRYPKPRPKPVLGRRSDEETAGMIGSSSDIGMGMGSSRNTLGSGVGSSGRSSGRWLG